jgi:hypothetical protein
MIKQVVAAVAVMMWVHAASAQAQDGGKDAVASPRYELFPTYDFYMSGAFLATGDSRFDWDANFGAAIDVVDYGSGRANFTANYNVVLGSQLRNFDPNQGNYVLELSSSRRFKYGEVHARFHHTSRHLADRFKLAPIDWNTVGVFITREEGPHGIHVKEEGSVERVLKRSYVDYTWLYSAGATAEFSNAARMTAIGRLTPTLTGRAEVRGTDSDVAHRDAQVGFYTEAAARIDGRKGLMEFYGGVERRIDASPLERAAKTWFMVGFRLRSR